MSAETWRPIRGYEGLYEVSDAGNVRRSPSARGRGARPGHVLRTNTNGRGRQHQWVTLYSQSGRRKYYVHRLVADAFLGAASPVVRHRDDHPTHNAAENLALGTQADNVHDMIRAGRARNGRADITQCPKSHPYDAENTRVSKRGSRHCRTCDRNRARDNYQRKAA